MFISHIKGRKKQSIYTYDPKRGMLVKVTTEKTDSHKPKRYCASPIIISNDVKLPIK